MEQQGVMSGVEDREGKGMNERIQIALASDDNYFVGLLVTAVSIARHADADAELVFNVLSGRIASERIERLRKEIGKAHAHASVRTFDVNEERFSAFPTWHGDGRMAYARLMLPDMLPEEDFVIYCDVDFLFTADVSELWRLRRADVALQACLDDCPTTRESEANWCARHGLQIDISHYFNSGMLIMNLRKFRENGYAGLLMDFLHRYPSAEYPDQIAMNVVIREVGYLPQKWCRFSKTLHGAELCGAWAIHYAGTCPWIGSRMLQPITDAHFLWYRFYGSLVGKSVWASMREFLSLVAIVKRRTTWVIAQHRILRKLVALMFRHGRHRYVIDDLEGMA